MTARIRFAFALACTTAIALVCAALQSPAVENPGFEQGTPGSAPPDWFVPQPSLDAGYAVRISSDNPKEGKQCAYITRASNQGNGFGNMMQSIDATPYRGKRVRFRAAVRFESGNGFGRAQLWLRVDRTNGSQGFFDNMGDRPIENPQWAFYDIVGTIDSDAASINFGMMLVGTGRAYIDAVTLGPSDGKDAPAAGAKALSPRGLENLTAYTKLLGYVRHFHPSDGVEKADWNSFAIAGIPIAEEAADATDLAQKLDTFFRQVAPTLRVYPTGKKPTTIPGLQVPTDTAGLQIVTWENIGFGGGTIPANQNIYRSKRVFKDLVGGAIPAGTPDPRVPFEANLGGGVSCSVPLALFAKGNSSFPRMAPSAAQENSTKQTGDDRNVRLADVVLAWNVYEHFYPYFDVVKTDWPAVLRQSLTTAATDADQREFLDTLRRMVAMAKDGHGNVGHISDANFAHPPFAADWVEGKFIVTAVKQGVSKPRAGDEILKIDGKKVADLWKADELLISGATDQWRRYRGKSMLLAGADESMGEFEFARGTAEPYTVSLKRSGENDVEEKRPKAIEEIKPGIWYVDLDGQRAKMDDYKKALPDLAKAKGIIFDMRGYPNDVAMDALQRCSDKPIMSALWNVPDVKMPDQKNVQFIQSRWPNTGPLDPRFAGKIAFISDGRAISYAESVMGIVENFKLGAIVGSTTAGTNGNINPFRLPGGYMIVFTGMKVIKHDGTTHHGIGIKPTVPVQRTIQGVMDGRDELLERAISVVGG